MGRVRTAAAVAALALVLAAIGVRLTIPADAQDGTEARLGALETQVAEQGDALSGLRKRVKRLEEAVLTPQAGDGAPPAGSDGTGSARGGTGAISVAGVGTAVSDKFTLASGRYKVTAAVDVADFSGFIVYLYGPGGAEESLFNELIDTPGTWTGSTVVTVPADGEAFVEVSNTTGSWTLTFEEF